MISLVLNYIYPKKYFFYRGSMLEKEIFAGFKLAAPFGLASKGRGL